MSDKPKFCVDCKHYEGTHNNDSAIISNYKCMRKEGIRYDFVTGKTFPISAFSERYTDLPLHCGSEAEYWEAKND